MDNRDGHVLIIGAASMDVKGQPIDSLADGTSAPGILRTTVGGTARNVAENLARLDVDTVLLTAVGDDSSGEQLLQHAALAGVNVSEARVIEGGRTGSYMALLNSDGSLRYALDDMEIMSSITPEYLERHEDLFQNARIVMIDANLPERSLRYVVSLCGELEIPLCADPTSATLARKLLPYVEDFYLLSPNVTETNTLVGEEFDINDQDEVEKAARQLIVQGVEVAIITIARFGVVYASSETSGHIPTPNTQIVDQTGAGDAQLAAIIFGLLEGIPIDESARLGVSAATLTLRTRYAVHPDLSLELLYDELNM